MNNIVQICLLAMLLGRGVKLARGDTPSGATTITTEQDKVMMLSKTIDDYKNIQKYKMKSITILSKI